MKYEVSNHSHIRKFVHDYDTVKTIWEVKGHCHTFFSTCFYFNSTCDIVTVYFLNFYNLITSDHISS